MIRRLTAGAAVLVALAPLAALSAPPLDVPRLVKQTQDAVVLVKTLDKRGQAQNLGSGFFIDSRGVVVTNSHVIEGASNIVVSLSNGAFFPVQKVALVDKRIDLAILEVDGRNLPLLKLADDKEVVVGQPVVAMGHPLGYQNSVSSGIVSAVREMDGRTLVQTTTPISSGNSGGPLLDARGLVVAVNTLSDTKGQNINFAIASKHVRDALAILAGTKSNPSKSRATSLYFSSVLAMNRKDYAAAERDLQIATRLDPDYFEAWVELGGVYYLLGAVSSELDAYRRAAQIRPDDDDARFYLATALEENDDFAAARAEYEKALALNPKHKDALWEFALLEISEGNIVAASDLRNRLDALNHAMSRKLSRIIDRASKKD